MTATTNHVAAHVLRTAHDAIKRETTARAELAAALTSDREITAPLFQDAITHAAEAAPWRDVLRLTERMTVGAALTAVRDRTTRTLLEDGECVSTSALVNEERRLRREGLRAFLRSTEVAAEALQEQEQEVPAPVAAVAEPAPTPAAPAPAAPVRRPTEAQLRLLQLIATGTVIVRENGRRLSAYCPTGNANFRAVETACRNGWAQRDNTTSLYVGQKVTLTPAGRALLPS
ncbi:hypothetical protein [Streptomyces variabilis]